MLEEIIKKDARVKIFPGGKASGNFSDTDSAGIVWGTLRRIVSETEVEVGLEEEISLEKNLCYGMYLLSYEKVYLTYVYYRSSHLEEGEPVVSLEIVSPIERVQRRMHQRVSYHAALQFSKISPEDMGREWKEGQMGPAAQEYEDTLVDISGGGIRFTTRREVNKDDCLYAAFQIERDGRQIPMSVTGQVVYAEKLRNEQEYNDIRMKFVGISEEDKEKMIRFVFQLERNT